MGCWQFQGYRIHKNELTSQLTNADWKMITISMWCGRLGCSQVQTQWCISGRRTQFFFHLFLISLAVRSSSGHNPDQSKHTLRHSLGRNCSKSTPQAQWRSLFDTHLIHFSFSSYSLPRPLNDSTSLQYSPSQTAIKNNEMAIFTVLPENNRYHTVGPWQGLGGWVGVGCQQLLNRFYILALSLVSAELDSWSKASRKREGLKSVLFYFGFFFLPLQINIQNRSNTSNKHMVCRIAKEQITSVEAYI